MPFLPAAEIADNDWWPWALTEQLAGEVSRLKIAERIPSTKSAALLQIVRQVLADRKRSGEVWRRLTETTGEARSAEVFEQCRTEAVTILVAEGVGQMPSSVREAFLGQHLKALLVVLGWLRSAAAGTAARE